MSYVMLVVSHPRICGNGELGMEPTRPLGGPGLIRRALSPAEATSGKQQRLSGR